MPRQPLKGRRKLKSSKSNKPMNAYDVAKISKRVVMRMKETDERILDLKEVLTSTAWKKVAPNTGTLTYLNGISGAASTVQGESGTRIGENVYSKYIQVRLKISTARQFVSNLRVVALQEKRAFVDPGDLPSTIHSDSGEANGLNAFFTNDNKKLYTVIYDRVFQITPRKGNSGETNQTIYRRFTLKQNKRLKFAGGSENDLEKGKIFLYVVSDDPEGVGSPTSTAYPIVEGTMRHVYKELQ